MNKETQPVEVTKIVIKIGGKEQTLSLKEARELNEQLNLLLGYPTPVYVTYQQHLQSPVQIWQHYQPPWKQWEVTCGGTGAGCDNSQPVIATGYLTQ